MSGWLFGLTRKGHPNGPSASQQKAQIRPLREQHVVTNRIERQEIVCLQNQVPVIPRARVILICLSRCSGEEENSWRQSWTFNFLAATLMKKFLPAETFLHRPCSIIIFFLPNSSWIALINELIGFRDTSDSHRVFRSRGGSPGKTKRREFLCSTSASQLLPQPKCYSAGNLIFCAVSGQQEEFVISAVPISCQLVSPPFNWELAVFVDRYNCDWSRRQLSQQIKTFLSSKLICIIKKVVEATFLIDFSFRLNLHELSGRLEILVAA